MSKTTAFLRAIPKLVSSLLDTRRLSDFEMIEAPTSAREIKEMFLEASSGEVKPGQLMAKLADEATRLAIAEVTLHQGVWPFRKSSRVRVIRPSAQKYWTFEDGEFTPGLQCEELERKWSIAYDYQRRFSLKRSLDLITEGSIAGPGN